MKAQTKYSATGGAISPHQKLVEQLTEKQAIAKSPQVYEDKLRDVPGMKKTQIQWREGVDEEKAMADFLERVGKVNMLNH